MSRRRRGPIGQDPAANGGSIIRTFEGFAGIRIVADELGLPDDPAVLLVHGLGQTRAIWADAAEALVDAGRRVIAIDLRGHGDSEWPDDGRYDFDAFVQDLRAVIAQLDVRPVVVADGFGAWIATAALAEDAVTLAAGLVLADLPTPADQLPARSALWDQRLLGSVALDNVPDRVVEAAAEIRVPVLFVDRRSQGQGKAAAALARTMSDSEIAEFDETRIPASADPTERFNAQLLGFLERRQPRSAPEFRSGSDARTLRDALGCFATGVTVVTAMTDDGMPVGLTANSFTSVSLDPPLLLVCIANNAGTAPVLREASHFVVNVLQIGQQPASNRFASRGEERFSATDWAPGENGAPVLTGSLSAFECARHAVHEGGDHFILVGRVERATFEPRRDPLLYFRGKYRRLHFA